MDFSSGVQKISFPFESSIYVRPLITEVPVNKIQEVKSGSLYNSSKYWDYKESEEKLEDLLSDYSPGKLLDILV